MKKCCHSFLFIFFFSFISINLFAQVEKTVRFPNGSFKTKSNVLQQSFKKDNLLISLYKEKYFVLLQFSSVPSAKQQLELKDAGVELNTYLPGNAYMASIKKDFDFTAAKHFNISSINVIPAEYKIASSLQDYQPSDDKQATQHIAVSYDASIEKKSVQEELQKAGATIVVTKLNPVNVIFIEADNTVINKIAALPFVNYISLQTMNDQPLNYNDVAAHGISAIDAPGGKNLTGDGVAMGIGDNADISTHIDFAGRLIVRTPWYPDFHGTHVGGTMGGAGIIDVKYHGMAPRATIINQLYSDIITNAATYIADNNMVVTNNSYYSVAANCPGEGEYDVFANYIDWQIKYYDQLLHVIAAGNDGALTCSPYPNAFGTVKSGWQSAKNVLTVGAMQTQDYTIASFSSRGPVQDGRIKPEVTAGGSNVYSTINNNLYYYDSGTSMATPAATGSLALMYQRYRLLHGGANPKSALMKAILCNTAEDLGNPGPDYSFGFGMIDARRAVEAIDSNWYHIDSVATGATANQTFVVPVNARRLKVMLYWADKEAAIDAPVTLVNDLDLTVTTPSAVTHHPFILNPSASHVNDNAVEGADHTNNIEQVTIENPVAGAYTVSVNGFNVPFGPQTYALTYEVLDSSVTVEYPYGGETWVPGETENIRWTAYGSESNSFTIKYSIDSGATWTVINNNVPSSSRFYSWLVPSTVTNKALIQVKRNGTNLIGQSNFNFMILGRPSVADTNICQGYVQLNWVPINGATSYDIMQLSGDTMKVIANTTDTFFVLKGLNRNGNYWLGVRAKNGTVAGRRSLSVNVIPNGGACTLSTFNNDLIVDSILTPNTARQFFANAASATAPVTIRIKNLGSTTVAAPFTVSYNSEGGSATETANTSIAAGATYIYTFTTPYTTNAAGFHYHFKAWATATLDPNHNNDTAFKRDDLLANQPITVFPVKEGFETTDSTAYTGNRLGLKGNDVFDFSTNTANGRARSFINTGFAHSGTKAMTLDQYPYATFNTTDSLTASYNLGANQQSQLRYDFYYKNQGAASLPGNKAWIRGNENSAWIQAYDLFANQADLAQWQHVILNINDILNTAVPAQTVSSTFQVRFGQEGSTSANTPFPLSDEDDGYTFDDLTLDQVFNDIAATNITSPSAIGCGLTATNPITVQVKNYNNTVLNNVPISYQINGGSIVTETIPSIPANTVFNYTFNQTANLSAYINYTINAWVKYPGDSYAVNDSVLNYMVHGNPVISQYPYLQGFEKDSGNFYSAGINSTWQWGMPNKSIINKAANGNNAWVTNLSGNYNNNETSYLYSPCFDLSSLMHPMLSFSFIYQVEMNFDYTWVEYTTDGINWLKLGTYGNGTNWYDNSHTQSWNTSDTIWHVASIDIPTTGTNVRFRFVLSSDEGVTYQGLGIDDIHIFDKAAIYSGAPITSNTQTVSGNNWFDFTSGGAKIVSINPNGLNLGLTNVQVYPYSGSVRNNNNQYYLNRNIVIQPANQPTGKVSVHFYFNDSEANNLINASGCASCSKPTDAYELGVTKYSGSVSDENGTLDDDLTGIFQYISPDSTVIIPYNTGYYASFTVNSFSEFWLNAGGDNSSNPLPLTLVYFVANKRNATALLQWSTENELNIHQFIIERSNDGKSFVAIGSVLADNKTGINQYAFIDSLPLQGINYYRLQVVGEDGTDSYSSIRQLDFAGAQTGFTVYPNPVTNGVLFIASAANCNSAELLDASGKMVRKYLLYGKNNSLNISGIAKGIYQLKIIADTSVVTEKILVQ